MIKPSLLEDWTTSQHNHTLVTVIVLLMLCYIQNKYSNIVQKVNIQFAFANNISKCFVKSVY